MKATLLKSVFLSFLAFLACAQLTSCDFEGFEEDDEYNNNNPTGPITNTNAPCADPVAVDFYAGQNILIGDITVHNSSDSVYIEIHTSGGWQLGHTHLYVGDLNGVPTTGVGNPQIGNFPYQTAHNPKVDAYTYVLPLASLDSCFVIAVHAEAHLVDAGGTVIQSETAWGAGTQFNQSGSWASYFDYCVQPCDEPCDPIIYPMYGGQTIPVGDLIVTNDNDFLYVTFQTTGGWYLEETHLYVGSESGLPTNPNNIPVPGQFPYSENHSNGTQTYTYVIPLAGLPPCYIIAAHSVVVEIVNGNEVGGETAWSYGTEFPDSPRWGWYSEYCTQNCL